MNHYLLVNETADNVPVQVDVGLGSLTNKGPEGAVVTIGKKVNICLAPQKSNELAALMDSTEEIGLQGSFVFRGVDFFPFIVNAKDVRAFLVSIDSKIRATLNSVVPSGIEGVPPTYFYTFTNLGSDGNDGLSVYSVSTEATITADVTGKTDIAFLDPLGASLEFRLTPYVPPEATSPMAGIIELGDGPWVVDNITLTDPDAVIAKLRDLGYTVTVFGEDGPPMISCVGATQEVNIVGGILAPIDSTIDVVIHCEYADPSGTSTFKSETQIDVTDSAINVGTWLADNLDKIYSDDGMPVQEFLAANDFNGSSSFMAVDNNGIHSPMDLRVTMTCNRPFFTNDTNFIDSSGNPTFQHYSDDEAISFCLHRDAATAPRAMFTVVPEAPNLDATWWKLGDKLTSTIWRFNANLKGRPGTAETKTGTIEEVMDYAADKWGVLVRVIGREVAFTLMPGYPAVELFMEASNLDIGLSITVDLPDDYFNPSMFIQGRSALWSLEWENDPPLDYEVASIFNDYDPVGGGTPVVNLVERKMLGATIWLDGPNTDDYMSTCDTAASVSGCQHQNAEEKWIEVNQVKLTENGLTAVRNHDSLWISNAPVFETKGFCTRFASTEVASGNDEFGYVMPTPHVPL